MGSNEVRTLLERHGLLARRDLGQNFLVDADLAHKLVKLAGVEPAETVIEVGTGLGILTRALAEKARRVVTVEVDAGIVRLLQTEGLLPESVTLLHADVLDLDLGSLVAEAEPPIRVVANLPYSVGSVVLRRLLDLRSSLSGWAVMIQKEVADRLTATAGSRAYSSLTVLHALTVRVDRVHELAPRCFEPPPKVTSSFLHFTPLPDSPVLDHELRWLEQVARAAFAHRRKTLVNSLRGGRLSPAPSPERIHGVLQRLGLDERVRAERLEPEQILALARGLAEPAPEEKAKT